MPSNHELHRIAAAQHGVVTLSNLRRVDVSQARQRTMVSRGDLTEVHPRVFVVGGSPRTTEQRVIAASLHRGAPAGFRTAAWLHGLPGFSPPQSVELLERRPTAPNPPPGVLVHSTSWLPPDDLVTVRGISTVGVARTVLCLCALVPRQLSRSQVKRAVDDACQLDLASDDWLWWRLERLRRSGRNGVRAMEEILLARAEGDVTESWLEAAALRLFEKAGLPTPICQARFEQRGAFVARVDFFFADERIIVEVNGHRTHRTREQVQHDAERTRNLVMAGYRVLTYTYDDVVRAPDAMVAQLRSALGQRSAA